MCKSLSPSSQTSILLNSLVIQNCALFMRYKIKLEVTIVAPNKALIGGEGEEYGGDVLTPGDVPHAVG